MRYWLLAFLLANTVLLLVEFHYGAFESAETEEIEHKDREKQTFYPSNIKTQAGLAQLSRLHHSPSTSSVNVEEKINAAYKSKDIPTQTKTSSQQSVGSPAAPVLSQVPGEKAIRTGISDNTDTGRGNGTSSFASPPFKPAEESIFNADFVLSEAGAKARPEVISLPALNLREAKNEDTEENMREPVRTDGIPKKAELRQSEPTARNSSAAVKMAVPSTESSIPEKKTVMDTISSNDANRTQTTATVPENQRKQESVSSACYKTAPIKDTEAFNALLNRFRPQLKDLNPLPANSKKFHKRNRYIVYSPAPATMEGSLYNANVLKTEYGIHDLQIIKDGELKGAISLGVYSNEGNAQMAKSQLEQQGLQVAIAPQFSSNITSYTVRMSWTDTQTKAATLLTDALTKSYSAKRAATCK
jgi:hypothetical protein